MEFTTDNACTTSSMRSDLAKEHSAPELVLHQSNVDVDKKAPWLEMAPPKPEATTEKKTAPSFMLRLMSAPRVTKANTDRDGTVVDSESDATD